MHTLQTPGDPSMRRVPLYRHLYVQVLVAIVLGALVGHVWPATGEALQPLGDAFIKMMKRIIGPVIFLTIVTGIAGMRELRAVGRVFVKAMAYFLFFSTLALLVGLLVAHVVQPGAGINATAATLDAGRVEQYVKGTHELTLSGFALDIIPKTLLSAFTGDNVLQVLLVAVLFGVSLASVGARAAPVVALLEALTVPVFRLVHLLMKAAPIGAFGAIAFTIGKYGLDALVNLAWLVGTFYVTSLLFVLVDLATHRKKPAPRPRPEEQPAS